MKKGKEKRRKMTFIRGKCIKNASFWALNSPRPPQTYLSWKKRILNFPCILFCINRKMTKQCFACDAIKVHILFTPPPPPPPVVPQPGRSCQRSRTRPRWSEWSRRSQPRTHPRPCPASLTRTASTEPRNRLLTNELTYVSKTMVKLQFSENSKTFSIAEHKTVFH